MGKMDPAWLGESEMRCGSNEEAFEYRKRESKKL
jgi:hypothetical protein